MSMTIDEHFVGMWFVPLAGHDDFLLSLRHVPEEPTETYDVVYRFRDAATPCAFEKRDVKRAYSGRITASREDCIERCRGLAQFVSATYGHPVNELMMNSERDVKRFTDLLVSMPWVHMKKPKRKRTKVVGSSRRVS